MQQKQMELRKGEWCAYEINKEGGQHVMKRWHNGMVGLAKSGDYWSIYISCLWL